MTRADQPSGGTPASDAADDALAAESRERAVGALLRFGPLRRLWSAQLTGGIGDALALLVLLLLTLQAATVRAAGGDLVFGGGYRGMALVITAVFGARLLATLLFGAVLLGPLAALVAPGKGPLDRRWTMFGADVLRVLALIVAPMWVDWVPGSAFVIVLATVFVVGVAERFWTVAKDSAAPALLPAPPPEGSAVRPLPDHQDALRRLWMRSTFLALPVAAIALVAVTLVSNVLASAFPWFQSHQAALGSYVAAGLFSAALSIVYFLELPDASTPRPRSPLEGLRRPKSFSGAAPDKGRTGAVPLLVLACSATAWATACAVSLAALHAADLGGGPIGFGLQVFVLTGGTAAGIRLAPRMLPGFSRRRMLAVAIGLTGVALLVAGLVTDATTGVVLMALAGLSAGVAAQSGHVLLDQETEDVRPASASGLSHRARMTDHLQTVVRIAIALGALAAPVGAGFIGPHRVGKGEFVFDHGGAAFTLMLVGALLLPVAALVLGRTDDRHGVTLRRDLLEALGGGQAHETPSETGFFIALEGGDGAGKTTQVEALAEWIRAKGHEVVVTKEPGSTPVGKRLRSILLDVSAAGLSRRSEALLYAADRAEHVDTVVLPALERGAIVISDRYIDSSVAYQGSGRDLSPTEVARISRWATGGLVPHLTVLLDVLPETARERFTEAPDRLESEPPEFHEKVRSGFLTLAAADPARYLVVDAAQTPEAITTVVRHRLDQVLPLSDAEVQAGEEARQAAEEEARRRAEEEAARKAEEERQERERQERMDRLRAEEQERKEREAELERQRAAARRAEEARQRAQEARRIAEEERQRREAEERTRAEEIARQRRLAEEEARLRAQAEERRQEKQRKAEEALQQAEQNRSRGEGSNPDGRDGSTAQLPQPDSESERTAERTHVMPQAPTAAQGWDEDTAKMPRVPADERERTREIPQTDGESGRSARRRSDWAEETPLDDVPSLADELLGTGEDDDENGRKRGRGGSK